VKVETHTLCKHCQGATRFDQGQAFVEFAVAISLLLLVAMSITYLATAIFAYDFVCYSARDATRFAAVHGAASPKPASSDDIRDLVRSKAVGLDPTQLTVATTWNPDNQPNSNVAVQVQYSFTLQIPFVPPLPFNLSSRSQLVISQ
jgi:Flp pilus assembly protein TadG